MSLPKSMVSNYYIDTFKLQSNVIKSERIYNFSRSCSKTCHLCSTVISATDFVYKLKGVYIHWDCFNCTACKVPLESGQKFGVIESMLYCEEHFLATKESLEQSNLSSDGEQTFDSQTCLTTISKAFAQRHCSIYFILHT